MLTLPRFLALLAATTGLVLLGIQFFGLIDDAPDREVRAACRGLRPAATNPEYGKINDFPSAKDFIGVQDHKGNPVSLKDFSNRVVVVNFWASWCKVCQSEKDGLERLQRKYGRDDLHVLALASDANWENVQKALPHGSPLSVFLDRPAPDETLGKTAKAYGITAVPESFVFDREGRLRYYFINRRDWNSDVAETCLDALIREGA